MYFWDVRVAKMLMFSMIWLDIQSTIVKTGSFWLTVIGSTMIETSSIWSILTKTAWIGSTLSEVAYAWIIFFNVKSRLYPSVFTICVFLKISLLSP